MAALYAKGFNQKLILLSGDIGCLDWLMTTLNEDLLLEFWNGTSKRNSVWSTRVKLYRGTQRKRGYLSTNCLSLGIFIWWLQAIELLVVFNHWVTVIFIYIGASIWQRPLLCCIVMARFSAWNLLGWALLLLMYLYFDKSLKYEYVLFSFSKSIMEGRKGLVLIYSGHCSFMLMAL
jgi:hypothetical protein